jgi:FkbM family methyltransferase
MGIARRVFSRDARGRLASGVLHALGLTTLCRKSSRYSYFTPSTVKVVLPNCPEFVMSGLHGQDHIVREIWIDGAEMYESPLPIVYAALAAKAQDVLDVGANSGLYALIAASCNARAAIYAFEPFPPAIRSLRANIALNRWQSRIEVIEGAAGERAGSFKLYVPAKSHGNTLETSCSLESTFRSEHDSVLDVQVTPLDTFVASRGVQRVSLLRADVEGAEYRVIEGAQEVLRTHRPFVLVEVLSDAAAQSLAVFPEKLRYECFTLGTSEIVRREGVVHVPARNNHLWCPRERLDELETILRSVQIAMR